MYRYNFFKTAIKVAMDDSNENIANMAIASRIAQLDGKKFTQNIDKLRSKPVNHKENLKRFGKK